MPRWVVSIFGRYGYFALFADVFLENTGIPIPGETVLLAAGFLARQHALRLPYVITVAAVAAMCGDNFGYWIGRRGGRRFVERRGKTIGLTPKRLANVEEYFRRHGPRAIFFARFISGLRVLAALTAGISNVPWRVFILYEASGAICWAVIIGALGYLFGQSWHLLERWVGRAGLLLVALIAVIVLFALLRRWRDRIAGWVSRWLPGSMTLEEAWLIAISLVAAGLLGKIVEDVTEHESTRFDVTITQWVTRLSFPAARPLMSAINVIGSGALVAAATVLAVVWYWRRGERMRCAVLATITIVALLFDALFRTAIHPVRPSFMAGETMNVVAIYGLMAFFAAHDHPRLRNALIVAIAALSLLVGFARVLLQLQWPTDVLAGYCAGLLLLLIAVFWIERFGAASEFS